MNSLATVTNQTNMACPFEIPAMLRIPVNGGGGGPMQLMQRPMGLRRCRNSDLLPRLQVRITCVYSGLGMPAERSATCQPQTMRVQLRSRLSAIGIVFENNDTYCYGGTLPVGRLYILVAITRGHGVFDPYS